MEILVSGAGPAGVATAIGLVRCGLEVALLTGPRTRPWLEGLSQRTRDALEEIGCREAAALAGDPGAQVRRSLSWGASRGEINRESLVERAAFDAALTNDARAAGVRVLEDSLLLADRRGGTDPVWNFQTRSGHTLRAAYWVDARGRSAPRGRGRVRGVATLALAIPCALSQGPARASALVAGERGFFWVVARGKNALVHWFRDPPRAGRAADFVREVGAELARLRGDAAPDWLAGLHLEPDPARRPRGRDATPYLVEDAIGSARVRVGDAAAATDPLSGQGVWRALAMARAATACARTQLEHPAAAPLAKRFYRGRVATIFWRDEKTGREFYRGENRWPQAPFWSRRRAKAQLSPGLPSSPEVATRPIVRNGYVEAGRVVRTPADPEGVWSIEGVPVVALMEAAGTPAAVLAVRFAVTPTQLEGAQAWLRSWGLADPTGATRKRAERLTAPHSIPQSGAHG
jgi:2-polyprenyl-6-methoxyphenol hydroxylase-like FAD-dependent oxidoreductase